MKNKRHAKILEIIQSTNTVTQSDLTEKLRECGFDVTQATVSRDIKALGLIKVSCGKDGYKYQQPSATPTASAKHLTIFAQSVIKIDCALHTVVVKTLAGMAQAAAAAIDSTVGAHILGSIAGDDTIIIVTDSADSALWLKKVLISMQAGKLEL